MLFLKFLAILFSGSNSWSGVIQEAFYTFGLWGIFTKCGMKGYYSLIPCYKKYCLAHCTDQEADGRELYLISLVRLAILFLEQILIEINANDNLGLFVALLDIVLMLVIFIYTIRLCSGLRKLFNLPKYWWFLLLFIPYVSFPLLGWLKRYTPQWTVDEFKPFNETYFSDADLEDPGEGLTLKLKERVAKELFSKKVLLRDIQLHIPSGHMVLLLGGSGAGKTTLVNAINGYEKADAEVRLDGSDVYREYKNMQYEVGFVPQLDLMRGNDTVYNTLKDASALRLPDFFSSEERKKRVTDVMELFGLTPLKDSMVEKLSGGQRKRLSIAMEFISNPSLFILDEPDSGLDGVMARKLMELLREIADQGKIVIVITHTPDRVIDLFDDVIVLAKDSGKTGRLAYYGDIAAAKAFFERDTMEHIVRSINGPAEGGEGLADHFVRKFAEVRHG